MCSNWTTHCFLIQNRSIVTASGRPALIAHCKNHFITQVWNHNYTVAVAPTHIEKEKERWQKKEIIANNNKMTLIRFAWWCISNFLFTLTLIKWKCKRVLRVSEKKAKRFFFFCDFSSDDVSNIQHEGKCAEFWNKKMFLLGFFGCFSNSKWRNVTCVLYFIISLSIFDLFLDIGIAFEMQILLFYLLSWRFESRTKFHIIFLG